VWAESIQRVMSDAALRASMRDKGLRQAARFRWDAAARQTAEVYSDLGNIFAQRHQHTPRSPRDE
jgi:hypothetical protein